MVAQRLNGIDLDNLQTTISTVQEHPELARFKFRTKNRWVNGTHNRASVKEFYEAGIPDESRDCTMIFEEDEPPVLLGENLGANPVEYILVGLSGCLTTSLVAQAAARGIPLKSVESELEGDLDVRGFLGLSEAVRNGYEGIRVKFKIESDAPEQDLQELVELAQQRSPVFDIVTNPVPVSVTFEKRGTR
ncbi:MAG TPA: OsmC family protein [Coleofasciculaceae cyanobacterium]|jgi:uncharacterized OsmC-like protein